MEIWLVDGRSMDGVSMSRSRLFRRTYHTVLRVILGVHEFCRLDGVGGDFILLSGDMGDLRILLEQGSGDLEGFRYVELASDSHLITWIRREVFELLDCFLKRHDG